MSTRKTLENVVKDGIAQGQAEVGQPTVPLTKADREKAGAQIVAAWYVRFWRWITFQGGK